MRLRIGNRTRPNNEAVSAISYTPVFDVGRNMIAVRERWDTSGRVVLQTAGQAQMTAALGTLLSDIALSNVDLVYLEDEASTETAMKLLVSDCLQGPTVIDAGLPNQANDVYATGMGYRVIWEALKPYGQMGNAIIEFSETVSEDPGGEQYVMVGGTVNLPERQVGTQHKPYTYVQSGSAVGMYARPLPPPPIWPWAAVCLEPKVTLISPRVFGAVDTEFGISWEYRFEWHEKLYGNPHRGV